MIRLQLSEVSLDPQHRSHSVYHGTTIILVRRAGYVVIGGDGQVSLGQTIVKSNARKIRALAQGTVIAGFAGSTADAFTLLELLENKLEQHQKQLMRACVEMAKDWRRDRYLRHLEAMILVADKNISLLVSGNGDVLEPEPRRGKDEIMAIGSGGNYALAAGRALVDSTMDDAETIARHALAIAGEICVYTNESIVLERLKSENS